MPPESNENETVEFEIEDLEQPDLPFKPDWSIPKEDMEIEVGPEDAEPNEEMSALIKKLEESNAEVDKLKTTSSGDAATKAVSDVVDRLAEKLNPPQQRPQPQQLPQETEEALSLIHI